MSGNKNWNMNTRGGRGNRRGSFRGGWGSFRGNQRGFGGYRGDRGGNRQRGNHGHFGGQNQPWKNRPKRDTPGKRLSEEDIGVTEYISDHKGFVGIIKSRYSDFQVSEINEEGQVAKLTDLSVPVPPADEIVDEDEDLLLTKYNLEILPMETWDNLNKLATAADPSATEAIQIDASDMSKELRTKIHDAVKKAFGESIVSSTCNSGDAKFVKFERFRKGVRIDNRVKWVWPDEYVYFIVHKENCDTMDAATRIAERLRLNVKPSMLGYAGTKDRRAKTSQWFSLRKVDPRKIANSCREMRDLRIGNFDFKPRGLRLGMLKGNKFRIALRNVTAPDDEMNLACEDLKEKGFINYYGLQRFGSRVETPTYQIGLKLLQGNFKEAIDGILEERSGPMQAALRAYRAEGAAAGVRAWGRRAPANIELRLLKALAAQPNNLLGALDKLARNTRLLYLHAYQSLVWNRAVSRRLARLGLAPAAGDLVSLTADDIKEEIIDEDIGEEEEDDEETNEKDSESDERTSQDTSEKEPKQKIQIKILTQEDVDSGKYTIADIIMPLPGYAIQYPPNMKEYYEELLTKDNLKLDMRHKIKSYSMSGAYRAVCVRPLGVSWRRVQYSDPYADLVLSDWDELQGRTLDGIVEDGKYKALLLTMTLPSSCYATMALRELLKVDTSCDNQALQNNYHKTAEELIKEKNQQESQRKENEDAQVEIKRETEEVRTDNGAGNGDIEIKAEVEERQTEKRSLEEEDVTGTVKKLKQEEE